MGLSRTQVGRRLRVRSAQRLPCCHSKLEAAVRYLGIEVDDALDIRIRRKSDAGRVMRSTLVPPDHCVKVGRVYR
ncbi:hypothetical protein ELS24_17495 [Achromobacter spanius]|nr:hypothetical protein ELS24_17495 [Achromobacter spanius]